MITLKLYQNSQEGDLAARILELDALIRSAVRVRVMRGSTSRALSHERGSPLLRTPRLLLATVFACPGEDYARELERGLDFIHNSFQAGSGSTG
jgi:hypothetical protein